MLTFSPSCEGLRNSHGWKGFKNTLYGQDWCPYIKETFNGFGKAIEYLGRYAHKIAISNSRILSLTGSERQAQPEPEKERAQVQQVRGKRRHTLPVWEDIRGGQPDRLQGDQGRPRKE